MKVDREDLIKDILRVYEENKGKFTRTLYEKKGKFSRAPIRRIFGGWNNMLKELNLEIKMHRNVSKEDVIADMKRLYSEHGKLTSIIQRRHSKYSQIVIDNLFGSFTNMMNELGLSSGYEKDIPRESLLEEARRVYEKYGYINSSLIENKSLYSLPTFYKTFGNMSGLYKALGVSNDPNAKSYFKKSSYLIGVVAEYLGETPIPEWTCEWLVNPETGFNLRVDAYFPKNNLVFEYDGEQHFSYIPFLHHSDKNKHIEQFKLDMLKNKLILEHGIKLMRFAYDEPIDIGYVNSRIEESIKS